DPARAAEAGKLAEQVQALLSGARPANEKDPNRALYDALVTTDGVLLHGLDLSEVRGEKSPKVQYGLDASRFGAHPNGKSIDEASIAAAADSVTDVRLPAALFRDREFVIDAALHAPAADRVIQFEVLTAPPGRDA